MGERLAIHGGKKAVPENAKKVKWPVITEEDKQSVMGVLERGVLFGPYAPEVVALQEEFAKYVGTKYCIATNSGTAALHMAIAAADIGPGDEVITSAFSFLASATCILHHNALPVFVDIDPATYNIDVNKIEEKITEKTKAIIPVHIHGLPCDMDRIQEIAKKHNLAVIEDACQSHGALYKGKKTGSMGEMATFSLNSTKNLVGGEGGLFVTNSEELRAKANMTRMFGEFVKEGEGRSYKAYTMGWMYRTQEMAAALTRSQLRRLDHYNGISQRNGDYLTKTLSGIKGLIPPATPSDRTHIYHKYRVVLDPKALGINMEPVKFRDLVMNALKAEGVDIVLWQLFPLPENPLFQNIEGYGKGCPWLCPHSRKADWKAEYAPNAYPATKKLVENSVVVCSEPYPPYCQEMELMEHYAEGFRKVFENIGEVVE
ncbi:MAG: DegT/DnrJ/EryC1/StrS family aminotransferase [Candidatus Omnitrophica bacterium]|nr:DegT/DnrJ/EryC1/StrS family aminotransferase [Candidatus Omnitrophota bacterium]